MSVEYLPSPPPRDPEGLREWLGREFQSIRRGLLSRFDLPVTRQAPARLDEGMLRYADGSGWDPGQGRGLYVFNGASWVKLS